MTISLGRLEHVDARTVWQSEPRDFTPWLAQNLGLLGEALGLDLELVQMEAPVGNYACDIEAKETNSGRRVIIENQLESTDHTHLGQLVTYAAGLDAAVIVWIATSVRDEHREAIDFLNRHTREAVDFFVIALELVRIGTSAPAVVFRLAASPNAWAKNAAARPEVSDRMNSYRSFFQPLMDELRERHHFTNARVAQPQSWYAFSSGVTGITYGLSFTAKGELRAEVYIDVGDASRNKAIFGALNEVRTQIEDQLGEPAVWEPLPERRASRIGMVRANTKIEDTQSNGDAVRSWAVNRLLKLKEVFGPRLRPLLASVPNNAANPPY
ncbi:DUF4268 domain-containing protein [Massilia sp. Root418]|jgi:hypothetical protein|uniref:DUF4268 domain-containing protein n=1 Tax=Massilia sp. Root418 TaxID=1736532 RepID=UPI0009EA84A3|nr:DUF4268 domain-containing protein [Massilia sp. Root418]